MGKKGKRMKYVAISLGVIAIVVSVYLRGFSAGKNECRNAHLEAAQTSFQSASTIVAKNKAVAMSSDDAVIDKWLREHRARGN